MRIRKTHITDAITRFFKSLSLKDRLEKNCAIERENSFRMQREYAKLCAGGGGHAAAGSGSSVSDFDSSDAASMITIDEEEKELLLEPMMHDAYKDIIPKYLVLELVQRLAHRRRSELPLKRKVPDSHEYDEDSGANQGSLEAGGQPPRKMVKGEPLEEAVPKPADDPFPVAMLFAEMKRPLPITWYSNKALHLIRNPLSCQVSIINTLWTNDISDFLDSQTEEHAFLREAGMTKTFCPTYELYAECAENHKQACALLDAPGSTAYKDWAESHHNFYANKADKLEIYDHWKKDEKKRREARTPLPSFTTSAYNTGYEDCKTSYKRANPPQVNNNMTCILCTRRGHCVEWHDDFHHGDAFPGPSRHPYWAKLRSECPDDLFDKTNSNSVCKTYNRVGDGHCNHSNRRLHICSFCGSSNHFALSWRCRQPR